MYNLWLKKHFSTIKVVIDRSTPSQHKNTFPHFLYLQLTKICIINQAISFFSTYKISKIKEECPAELKILNYVLYMQKTTDNDFRKKHC